MILEFLLKMIEINALYSAGIPIGLAVSTLIFILYKTYMVIPWKTILLKEVHKKLEPRKRELFEEATLKIESQMEKQRCEVLEIGVGTGENFKFFPKDSNVTILDNTDKWLPTLKGNSIVQFSSMYFKIRCNTSFIDKRFIKIESRSSNLKAYCRVCGAHEVT